MTDEKLMKFHQRICQLALMTDTLKVQEILGKEYGIHQSVDETCMLRGFAPIEEQVDFMDGESKEKSVLLERSHAELQLKVFDKIDKQCIPISLLVSPPNRTIKR